MVTHYRDLKVWQKSMELVFAIYKVTAGFPKEETYGLTSQIRRCAVSLPSNIAEGSARHTSRDFLRFISIAHGSLAELDTQLSIAKHMKWLTEDTYMILEKMWNEVGRMLTGLQKKLEEKLATNHSPLATQL